MTHEQIFREYEKAVKEFALTLNAIDKKHNTHANVEVKTMSINGVGTKKIFFERSVALVSVELQ